MHSARLRVNAIIRSLQIVAAATPSALRKSQPVVRHSTWLCLRVLPPLSDQIVLDAFASTKCVAHGSTPIP